MSEKAKKYTWLALLLIATAAELIWIWLEATDYLRIRPFHIFWFMPWIVYGFIIVLLLVDYKRTFLITCYTSLAILILNSVLLQLYKPEYRYKDAVAMIQKAENIPVSNGDDRKVKTMEAELPYQQYVITGLKDDQVVQFLFDPYKGEYLLLDISTPFP